MKAWREVKWFAQVHKAIICGAQIQAQVADSKTLTTLNPTLNDYLPELLFLVIEGDDEWLLDPIL